MVLVFDFAMKGGRIESPLATDLGYHRKSGQ
jgi:hypothetical protein